MNKLIEKGKLFFAKHNKLIAISATAVAGLTLASSAFASGVDTMTSLSQDQFIATTGFSYSDLVTKVGSWMLMILGAGLGLVDSILGWIIAFIVISVIVGIAYGALRWLHILR